MAWYNFIGMGMPLVFSPKVTPDPIAAERLEEKLQQAVRLLDRHTQQKRLPIAGPPPASVVNLN